MMRPLFRMSWSDHRMRGWSGMGRALLGEVAILGVVFGLEVRKLWVQRRLVERGAVTSGRTASQHSGTGDMNLIAYTFVDASSREFKGSGMDFTRSCYEGTPVLVFYDAAAPERNIAQPCALYELK